METSKRISLNTTLKEANIFRYDSDEEDEFLSIKTEIKVEKQETILQINEDSTKYEFKDIKFTQEVPDLKIKQDMADDDANSSFTKMQKVNETSPSNSVLDDSSMFTKMEKIEEEDGDGTVEDFTETSNSSVLLEKVADLVLRTPMKDEYISKISVKSTKRTLIKERNSPYAKEKFDGSPLKRPQLSKNRARDEMRTKFDHYERESDPDVLSRRQKQIDFGKNTVGYDNYRKLVAKDQRKQEDPVTPNKFRKYSRRGFDGLIKQWRLKLHKYDP